MTSHEELDEICKKLDAAAAEANSDEVSQPLEALDQAAKSLRGSFSGSWLGYHSKVYYAGLKPAPAGANFSSEWGFDDGIMNATNGDWNEFQFEEVIDFIRKKSKNPDLSQAIRAATNAEKVFSDLKSEISSILQTEMSISADNFLSKLHSDLENIEILSKGAVLNRWKPNHQLLTRDSLAASQGLQIPPHLDALAEVASYKHSFGACAALADLARKAASHLQRQLKKKVAQERIGTNVFIGHGRSPLWRELKDFIQDRIGLPPDEFNRVPIAGFTNIARLSQMLDAAAIAFLVMTAEDEMVDGGMQARMNVIHEAGLFQGRLGFEKAIILLEEGCQEFSNVQGLGQIRFPAGNIKAAFEDIRCILERENLI